MPYLELPSSPGDDAAGPSIWRLMTHIEGATFDVVADARQAHAAGALVGHFHAALAGLDHVFVGRRAGVHDTARHLDALDGALARHRGHRLQDAVERLAADVRGCGGPRPAAVAGASGSALPRRPEIQQPPLRGTSTS